MTTTVSACCGAEIEMKHRVYIGDGWEYCSKCKKLLKYLTKEEVDKWGNPPTETVSDCQHIKTKVIKVTDKKYHVICKCGKVAGVIRRTK